MYTLSTYLISSTARAHAWGSGELSSLIFAVCSERKRNARDIAWLLDDNCMTDCRALLVMSFNGGWLGQGPVGWTNERMDGRMEYHARMG